MPMRGSFWVNLQVITTDLWINAIHILMFSCEDIQNISQKMFQFFLGGYWQVFFPTCKDSRGSGHPLKNSSFLLPELSWIAINYVGSSSSRLATSSMVFPSSRTACISEIISSSEASIISMSYPCSGFSLARGHYPHQCPLEWHWYPLVQPFLKSSYSIPSTFLIILDCSHTVLYGELHAQLHIVYHKLSTQIHMTMRKNKKEVHIIKITIQKWLPLGSLSNGITTYCDDNQDPIQPKGQIDCKKLSFTH